MAEKCKKSSGKKADVSIRVGITYRNKVKALNRHLKRFPDDKQAIAALEALKKKGTITPRKAPLRPIWKDSTVYLAQLAAQAGYKGNVVLKWMLRDEKNAVYAYSDMRDPYAKVKKDAKPAKKEEAPAE